jgi:hypothetical protein
MGLGAVGRTEDSCSPYAALQQAWQNQAAGAAVASRLDAKMHTEAMHVP